MPHKLTVFILAFLAASAQACNLPQPLSDERIATSVAATKTAGAAPTQAATQPTAQEPAMGIVTGRMCYPSEGIPPMTAYFQNTEDGTLVDLPIAQDQGTYSLALVPGSYIAYAWLPGFSYGGSYSPAVPCGLTAACTDHSPLAFTVTAGQTTSEIDLCDWYGDPGSVPLPPGAVVATATLPATATVGPSATPAPPTATSSTPGGISGNFTYPGSIPALVVLAFNLDTPYWWWVGTASGQAWYAFDDIPPGRYQVVGYGPGLEASYADGGAVTVNPGQTTTGIDLTDWRPAGTYRAKPGGINYP